MGKIWIWTDIVLLCAWSVFCHSLNNGVPITIVQNGYLRGLVGSNLDGEPFFEFLGIPYAKPPINELRFQPPQPDEPWQGIYNATADPASCLSRDDFTRELIGSEDCLYLNVYTKRLPTNTSTLQPVMVYIYGGGLIMGSSRPGMLGPEFLLLKDIVLVTINYRLGALGFLSLSDPDLQVYGNMGFKDQNLALKWVQTNIKNFNGNPKDVTIFGHSAGAASVQAHILSPASEDLFHKAIIQSGSVLSYWFWGTRDNALQLVVEAGKNASSQKDALGILKTMPAEDIFAAQEKIYDPLYPAESRPFAAVLEAKNPTEFLNQNPVKVIESGKYNQVPMIIGYADSEGMLLDLDQIAQEKTGFREDLQPSHLIPVNLGVAKDSNLSKVIARILGNLYQGKSSGQKYNPIGDAFFVTGIYHSADLHRKSSRAPVYFYRMSLSAGLNLLKLRRNKIQDPGAGHSDELGYLFHTSITPAIAPGSLEDRCIRTFVDLWTNFAISGNPTPKQNQSEYLRGISWSPLNKFGKMAVLDIGSKLEVKDDIPERQRMDVWGEILKHWPLKVF